MGRQVWQSGGFRFAGGMGGSHHYRVTEYIGAEPTVKHSLPNKRQRLQAVVLA
jgi:hypothetical protein